MSYEADQIQSLRIALRDLQKDGLVSELRLLRKAIEEQNELLYKSLESFDEEYKKVEEEIHKLENENIDIDAKINRYSNEYERINSYFGR